MSHRPTQSINFEWGRVSNRRELGILFCLELCVEKAKKVSVEIVFAEGPKFVWGGKFDTFLRGPARDRCIVSVFPARKRETITVMQACRNDSLKIILSNLLRVVKNRIKVDKTFQRFDICFIGCA